MATHLLALGKAWGQGSLISSLSALAIVGSMHRPLFAESSSRAPTHSLSLAPSPHPSVHLSLSLSAADPLPPMLMAGTRDRREGCNTVTA